MAPMSGEQRHAVVLLALPPTLAVVAGTPAAALRALHGPAGDALGTGPLLGALGLLAWVLTGWLALVVLTCLGARLQGSAGRVAQRCLNRLAPTAVRTLVRTATGVAVAGTVLLSGTAAHADSLDWPTTASPATSTAATAGPAASPTPTTTSAVTAVTTPSPSAAPVDRPTATPRPVAEANEVVVQPGDCLWHLAAAALGPDATPRQIAAAWPSWWSANRAVIGGDPNLLRPGTSLTPPTPEGAQP